MTRSKILGAALALAAFIATPVLAQVSEPAAAAARDPNFSIYSSPSNPSRYSPPAGGTNAMVGMHVVVRSHRPHRAPSY
jgi:hypothetical protein